MVSNDDFDGKATHINCFYLHINFEQKYPKPAIVAILVTKYYRFGFKKVFASLCEPKKRQKSSGTFVALLISLVLAWKLRKVAAQPRLVHKAKLTSRKLAISFLVTECVVLHMSVYGKKKSGRKRKLSDYYDVFTLFLSFLLLEIITKIKYKETLKCL